METTIEKPSPVEYELKVHATADDIEPRLTDALKQQRKQVDLKGFRKGKAPLKLIKKMHGEAIGYSVAEDLVQEAFEDEVENSDAFDVLGQPQLTELDYELDGDLHATIRFGVRPDVELQDFSEEEISKLTASITEEDVEDEIDELRVRQADLLPLEDEPAGEEDYVNIDLQRIDPSTDTPIIGDKDEDLSFFLDDERLREELREELVGRTAGEDFRVELPQQTPQGETETRFYDVTVKDVKRRELPEVDEHFVRSVTEGEYEDPDELRGEIRDRLEEAWEEQSREMLQGALIERMLELHTFPVPESVVETYLDSFVEDVKQQNDGELPDDFDEEHFRNQKRGEAERQAKWMLIRDAIIEEHDIEVTDEDLEEFFDEQADDEISSGQIKHFYRSMPKLMRRVEQQVLSQKVFDTLVDSFDVVEKDREAYEEEMKERHEHHGPERAPAGRQGSDPVEQSSIIT